MADHTAIVSEVRDLMTAGNKRDATRLVRRYADGADTALAEDLGDRAQAVLDRETEAHAARIAEARRAQAARAIADRPRATRTRRTDTRPAARTHREAHAQKTTVAYFAHRDTTTPDHDRRDTTTYGSGLDYDLAAVPARRGRGCLVCGIERSSADRSRKDGLCTECRESGMTRADGIAIRCSGLVARAHKEGRTNARDALAEGWRRATPADRALIEQWVLAHPETLAGVTG
jgi:hypothetical protein